MPEPLSMGIVWLGEILIGGYIYDQIKNKLGKDKFSEILQKAQKKLLKKENNRIIWNEIYALKDTKIKDPIEFNYKKILMILMRFRSIVTEGEHVAP